MENHFRICDLDPKIRGTEISLEKESMRLMQTRASSNLKLPVTIRVIVHVVYNQDHENISDGQIEGQIRTLNEDFRFQNKDKANIPSAFKPLASDAGIKFDLVKTTRTQTDHQSFPADDSVKHSNKGGVDAEEPSKHNL